jgi:hypothetical protein
MIEVTREANDFGIIGEMQPGPTPVTSPLTDSAVEGEMAEQNHTHSPIQRAVLVTGSRDLRDLGPWSEAIWNRIAHLKRLAGGAENVTLIHGDCRGADRMAANAATALGMIVKPFPYPSGMGKSGGPYRNRQMLKELIRLRDEHGAVIVVYAFHPDIKNSKGTKDMINAADAADVRVRLFEVPS